jgi:hypothetical protein
MFALATSQALTSTTITLLPAAAAATSMLINSKTQAASTRNKQMYSEPSQTSHKLAQAPQKTLVFARRGASCPRRHRQARESRFTQQLQAAMARVSAGESKALELCMKGFTCFILPVPEALSAARSMGCVRLPPPAISIRSKSTRHAPTTELLPTPAAN